MELPFDYNYIKNVSKVTYASLGEIISDGDNLFAISPYANCNNIAGFKNNGDEIIVSTDDGKYVSRK